MTFLTTPASNNGMATQLIEGAEHALASTQQAAVKALDQAGHQAGELLHSSLEVARVKSHQLTDAATHAAAQARDGAVRYVKDEPVKAMLIAAATGAALMALVSLLGHSRARQ